MARRKRRHYGREEIQSYLQDYDASDETHVAFASRHGLSLSTFRSWLAKRRRADRGNQSFLPVAVVGGPAIDAARLELVVDDRRVSIPADIDPRALAELLPVILAAC